ncbi:MAG: GNAT family N-acetyltransferase [Candidatus Thorarchaeota archaeon]|nr:GNAT family N-acetyltransferase [Candidatus Thorarchaeota archaeon]
MVRIRQGVMKDCKDLLEVYMGTRWSEGFSTVEQVKAEHRGIGFEKWGWLVAELRGKVIGEIIFRIEKNPAAGRLGIIQNLGVDVRHQKKGYGTKLTRAAEKIMRERKVGRIVATTPPEAYNYWMKIDYHKRYWVMRIGTAPAKIPPFGTKKVLTKELAIPKGIPTSMRFSNIAYPGMLAAHIREVVTDGKTGSLFEYVHEGAVVGVGVVVKESDASAKFTADVNRKGTEFANLVIARTAKAASKLKTKSVHTLIPQDRLDSYKEICKWTSEMDRNFPVTRLT